MNEQDKVNESAEDGVQEDSEQGRERSRIAFPYMDLNSSVKVVDAIHANAGTGNCSLQQLSAWMDQSIKSSGFRVQIASARLFGLIESDGSDSYRLTFLGRRVVDPTHCRKAKSESFLMVPLFSALFERYKEGILPPTAALEREIAGLGVAVKQKDRARQVFERSADQAAFFEHGKNRLVMPAVKAGEGSPPGDQADPKGRNGGGGSGSGGEQLELDPLLMALLRKIPPSGEEWPSEKRLRWFKTFAMNVSQVYDGDDDPVELKIDKSP